MVASRNYLYLGFAVAILEQLLESPAKTACIISIDSFENEQDGADFKKENGADEGSYPAAVVRLPGKLCLRCYQWKPRKEALEYISVNPLYSKLHNRHDQMPSVQVDK